MRIAELFHSIQGEGKLVGTPSAFVRTAGCNLGCRWCDTEYANRSENGQEVSVAAIVETLTAWNPRHVVVTGGEPMIQPEVVDLTQALRERGLHITVETAGTVYHPVACDLMSISPKLGNSTPRGAPNDPRVRRHEQHRLRLDCLSRLMAEYPYQLKFVVAAPKDLGEIRRLVTDLGGVDPDDVLLMPEGTTRERLEERASWLIELCKDTGFRYCPRLHIELFGHQRGT